MTKKPKYLIFDFDGVLGNTFDLIVDTLMNAMAINKQSAIDLIIKLSYTNVRTQSNPNSPKIDLRQIATIFTEEMIFRGELFHGFIDELNKLENTKIAIVTSGWSKGVNHMLKQAPNLNFDYVLTSEDNPSKIVNVQTVLDNWGVGSSEVLYFADTISDIQELKEIFVDGNMIGCSWGYHGYDILAGALPEGQIMREYGDIRKVVNQYKNPTEIQAIDLTAQYQGDIIPLTQKETNDIYDVFEQDPREYNTKPIARYSNK